MQQRAEEAKKQEMKKAQQECERLDLLQSFGGPVENSEDLETFLQNLSGNTKTLQLKVIKSQLTHLKTQKRACPNDLFKFSAAKKQLSLEQLKANLRQILEHPAPSNTPGTEQNEEVLRGESPLPRPEDDADGTDDSVSHLKAAFTVKAVEARQRQEVPVQQDSRLANKIERLNREVRGKGEKIKVVMKRRLVMKSQVVMIMKSQQNHLQKSRDFMVSKRQKRMDREALLQEDNALDVVPLRDIKTDDPEVDEEYLTRFLGDQKYYTARVIEFSDNKAQLLKKVCDDITGKKKKQKKGAGGSKEKANNASKKLSRLKSIIATFRYRRQLDEYRARGINLKQHMYVPEQVGGVYVPRREDHCHILKRIASHLRGEPPRWFNHHALEEALHPVEGEPKTRLTEAALFGWRKQSVKEEPPVISCCHVPPSQRTDLRHRVMEFGPVDVAAVIRQASICEQARHAENLEEIEKLREEKRETEGEGISAMEAELGKERAKNWRRYASDVKDYHVIPCQLSSVKEWKFDANDDAVKQHDVMVRNVRNDLVDVRHRSGETHGRQVTGRDRDALKELLKFKPQRRERLDRLGQLSQIEFDSGCLMLWSEETIRVWHKRTSVDIAYLDATGNIVTNKSKNTRQHCAYELVVRHPKPGAMPLACGTLLTNDHTVPLITFFLQSFRHTEAKIGDPVTYIKRGCDVLWNFARKTHNVNSEAGCGESKPWQGSLPIFFYLVQRNEMLAAENQRQAGSIRALVDQERHLREEVEGYWRQLAEKEAERRGVQPEVERLRAQLLETQQQELEGRREDQPRRKKTKGRPEEFVPSIRLNNTAAPWSTLSPSSLREKKAALRNGYLEPCFSRLPQNVVKAKAKDDDTVELLPCAYVNSVLAQIGSAPT
ncbi:carbohydrate binding [Branchiostoma belcheri]|nr:carbohydrate binding [Branchiostoma belcheri]